MIAAHEWNIVSYLLKKNNLKVRNEDEFKQQADLMLTMKEDEVKKSITSCKATMVQGNMTSESLSNALFKLFICLMRRKKLPGLNDRNKKALDGHILEVMQLLFAFFDNSKSEQNKLYALDIAKSLYNMTESDNSPDEEETDQFLIKMRGIIAE